MSNQQPEFINKPTPLTKPFTGAYNGKIVWVYAKNLGSARQALTGHFDIKKIQLRDLKIKEGQHASVS